LGVDHCGVQQVERRAGVSGLTAGAASGNLDQRRRRRLDAELVPDRGQPSIRRAPHEVEPPRGLAQ